MNITITRRGLLQGAAATAVIASVPEVVKATIPEPIVAPKRFVAVIDADENILGMATDVVRRAIDNGWTFDVGTFNITHTGTAQGVKLVYDGLSCIMDLRGGLINVCCGDTADLSGLDVRIAPARYDYEVSCVD